MDTTTTTRALETEWSAVESAADFPMEWVDACPGDRRCPDSPPPERYPAIRLYRGREPFAEYDGPRTSDEYTYRP